MKKYYMRCSTLRSTICVFSSFSWEEEEEGGGASSSSSSLLAVGTQGEVTLLRVEAEPSSSIRVLRVSGCPAERLLQTVREQDPGEYFPMVLEHIVC